MRAGTLVLAGTMSLAAGLISPPETDAAAGLSIRWVPAYSGNYSRRSSRSIDRIVIHTIEGQESSAIHWFQNPRAKVSAHYLVAHSGRLTQMVRDNNVAWHSGTSSMNARSIGIENEGFASRNNWTTAQYESMAKLVRSLCDRYRIPMDRAHIIGHSEVRKGRKVDPGRYFDWNRFMTLVRGGASSGGGGGGATTTPAPAPTGTFAVEITASSLRVRNGVWGTILGHVRRGQRFVVRESRQGWFRIDYASNNGWISGDYARRLGKADMIEVTASGLNARTGPSTSRSILTVVRRGQAYVVTGRSGAWLEIQVDQRKAWVASRYTRGLK